MSQVPYLIHCEVLKFRIGHTRKVASSSQYAIIRILLPI